MTYNTREEIDNLKIELANTKQAFDIQMTRMDDIIRKQHDEIVGLTSLVKQFLDDYRQKQNAVMRLFKSE